MVSGFEEPRSVAAIVGQSSQRVKIVVWNLEDLNILPVFPFVSVVYIYIYTQPENY